MNRRGWMRTGIILGAAMVLVLSCCLAPVGLLWPIQLIVTLASGWAFYLTRVSGESQVDSVSIATGLSSLALFTGGLHAFCRWLSASYRRRENGDSGSGSNPWRARWTLSAVSIVLLLFVAGIAMVGITHQIAWMASSDESLFDSTAFSRHLSSSNLGNIGSVIAQDHDEHGAFVPGMIADDHGRALHGWQALILPKLPIEPLQGQIDLSKPYDDQANERPLAESVWIFVNPGRGVQDADYLGSHYSANQHVMGGTHRWTRDEIIDGTANTLLIGEAAGNFKPWGYPRNWRDPMIGLNTTPDGFGGPWPNGGTQFAMADGSVRRLRDDIDPKVLRALATPAGGEEVAGETDARR